MRPRYPATMLVFALLDKEWREHARATGR